MYVVLFNFSSPLFSISGANVDDESAIGRTPLHECSEGGHVNVTELLLKVGRANPTPRDGNDLTPYDIAYSKMHKEVIIVLQLIL